MINVTASNNIAIKFPKKWFSAEDTSQNNHRFTKLANVIKKCKKERECWSANNGS